MTDGSRMAEDVVPRPRTDRVRTYRFHGAGFRNAECRLCRSLLRKSSMNGHALWHARRNEDQQLRGGTEAKFCDITVVAILGEAVGEPATLVTSTTGWVTTSPGPK